MTIRSCSGIKVHSLSLSDAVGSLVITSSMALGAALGDASTLRWHGALADRPPPHPEL
jgi:hypothetical protein